MRVVTYGSRQAGKTAGTALIFGMLRMAGHSISVVERRQNTIFIDGVPTAELNTPLLAEWYLSERRQLRR